MGPISHLIMQGANLVQRNSERVWLIFEATPYVVHFAMRLEGFPHFPAASENVSQDEESAAWELILAWVTAFD